MPSRNSLPHRRGHTAALACLLAIAMPVPSADNAPCARLAPWIQAELDRTQVPSLAIAVARNGRIVCADGFGWADRAREIPATAHTRYSIASISKPITATALMRLVHDGLVDLDESINRYLGDSPVAVRVGNADAVTVRRVAAHMAGLPLHHHFFVEGRTPPPMEETIRRYGDIVFPPGTRYQYSNLGYGVLEHVIARLGGGSYEAFVDRAVLQPLGMSRTSVGLPADDEVATRYTTTGVPLPFYDFDHRGGSAVFSTAHDLARFGLFHLGRPLERPAPILSRAMLRQMQEPHGETGVHGYGIGWQIRTHSSGHLTVTHTGGMPGVSTSLTLVPASGLVVVALANASTSLPQQVTERVLAQLLPRFTTSTAALRLPAAGTARLRSRPARALVGDWTGSLRNGDHLVPVGLHVTGDGEVAMRLGDDDPARVTGASFERAALRGVVLGAAWASVAVGTRPHALYLDLVRHGDILTGSLTAVAPSDPEIGFALSQWVHFWRDEAEGPPAAAHVR